MNRMRQALVATLVGVSSVGSLALVAQTQSQAPPPAKAPEMKQVLAGKKFMPPIKGLADVDYTLPVTKRVGNTVVTKVTVKNMSNAPIPRLTVDETWFDKSNNIIPGGKGVINGLLQPGEIRTLELTTQYNPKMSSNSWTFSHANGQVKPHRVKSLDAPEDAQKKPAPKTPAKKK